MPKNNKITENNMFELKWKKKEKIKLLINNISARKEKTKIKYLKHKEK
jgi:hypothetical protein